MEIYLDTSLLAKIYVPEEDAAERTEFLKEYNRAIEINFLQETELKNAFSLKFFRKEISLSELNYLTKKVGADIESGALIRVNVTWSLIFAEACNLSNKFTGKIGCRTMDILHVAAAYVNEAQYFLTGDLRQKKLAEKIGLKTYWD